MPHQRQQRRRRIRRLQFDEAFGGRLGNLRVGVEQRGRQGLRGRRPVELFEAGCRLKTNRRIAIRERADEQSVNAGLRGFGENHCGNAALRRVFACQAASEFGQIGMNLVKNRGLRHDLSATDR
jgi:hypothetical protein